MICALCGREVDVLTEHHLKPRSRLKKKETTQIIKICSACHRQLHALFTNAELAKGFDSVERLRDEPRMAKFLDWVRKQDPNRQIKVRG
jgi:5-methylcytosine-specific restriction endonuclease McrA